MRKLNQIDPPRNFIRSINSGTYSTLCSTPNRKISGPLSLPHPIQSNSIQSSQSVNQYVSELMDNRARTISGSIRRHTPEGGGRDEYFSSCSMSGVIIDCAPRSPYSKTSHTIQEPRQLPCSLYFTRPQASTKAGQEIDTTRLGRGRSASALVSWNSVIIDYADTACSTQVRAFVRFVSGLFLCHYSQRTTLHEVLSKQNKAR
ncbi:hypothetical protein DFH08DRAFT_244336 [Mycena albidolilacea]|uniref:Uncharacterized protein n=1 Tax=Mycena albidolilacea TaxID=1033008 RepID=A0AAD6ZUX4_9AGAR|nr:hypothetical protein DFH08DRAFT_244336 [Mycena albidolilacea]